jgi:hypothetical protein
MGVTMKTARVQFSNGDSVTTSINGTDTEIIEYYKIGRWFNLGDGCGGDLMARVVKLEIVK